MFLHTASSIRAMAYLSNLVRGKHLNLDKQYQIHVVKSTVKCKKVRRERSVSMGFVICGLFVTDIDLDEITSQYNQTEVTLLPGAISYVL